MSRRLALCSAIAMLLACGGRQSVASKSAAAYAEAVKKGTPVTAGDHGGGAQEHHAPEPAPPATAHEAMPGMSMDHSKMDHSQMAGMDHSKMDHSQMAGMDHSKMDHSAMPGMDHSQMDHSQMHHGTMAGMQHEHSAANADVTMNLEAPRSSGAMARVHPDVTLHPDEFDAPKTKDR